MVYIAFYVLLDSVCFVEDWYIYIYKDYSLKFSFPVRFDIRVILATENEFGSVPASSIFLNCLQRIGVDSSLNIS